MVWRASDEQGDEASKVKYEIVQYTRGKGIDLGCGPHKAFPHFIGVDSCKDTELFNIEMKPDVVCEDASKLDFIEDGDLDFVFSSHLLEHIQDTGAALAEWWSKIKVGGHLVLYLPDASLYPNIGTDGANPDHKHDFDQGAIMRAMLDMADGWDLIVDELRGERMEYSFLQVYCKRADLNMIMDLPEQHEKTACICRFGGFGDMIQASNILPELKHQDYHVTFMATPKGQDILKHDPHIDDWLIVDDEQVPNNELGDFWAAQARRFTKFINLSESVEGTLLAMPGRANHMWPDAVRRVELNRNYLEWTAQLAELPYMSESRFYPAKEETAQAASYLGKIAAQRAGEVMIGMKTPPRFNIVWVLSGSSPHKFYPHQDQVIARILLDMPEAEIIFNGEVACKILEAGWEMEPRVHCESGEMSIRDGLALAIQADCVVGPETGVLNAVAFESMPKVILLSHSTVENLTKHWNNAASIEPENTPCYPCHRLHFGREHCPEHVETGSAMCQVSITPDRVYDAIHAAYLNWKRDATT